MANDLEEILESCPFGSPLSTTVIFLTAVYTGMALKGIGRIRYSNNLKGKDPSLISCFYQFNQELYGKARDSVRDMLNNLYSSFED